MSNILQTVLSLVQGVCIAVAYTSSSFVTYLFTKKKSLENEVILITGGGRGFGKTLALCIAKTKPKHIVLCGRNVDCLKTAQAEIQELGVKVTYYQCDVSKREDIYAMAEDVVTDVGPVTMLVNNAGVVSGKSIIDTSPTELEYCLQVNTLSHIWAIKAFLPTMIENKHGHIVCINSLLGLLTLKGACDYNITKYAGTGLMESLCHELEDYPEISTTIIHPYQIDNDMFAGITNRFPMLFPPLKETYVAEETVKAIQYNRKQLVLPVFFNIILLFKSILPVSCLIVTQQFLGMDRTMDGLHKT